jgi:hypothetical protein
MIVGSVLPVTLRRQAEVKRAHRTAGPDHESGPSDPMFPKPLDARLSGALRLQGRSVSLNRFRNTSSDGLVIPSLHRKSIRILSRPDQRPKGAHPSEVRVRVGSDDEDSWPIDFGEVQSGCLLYPRLRTKIGLLGDVSNVPIGDVQAVDIAVPFGKSFLWPYLGLERILRFVYSKLSV